MTAALEGGEWSAARPGRTLHPGKTRYPFYSRLGGRQGRSGRAENLVPTGIRSRTVQSVVSRYTDWATRLSDFVTSRQKSQVQCFLTLHRLMPLTPQNLSWYSVDWCPSLPCFAAPVGSAVVLVPSAAALSSRISAFLSPGTSPRPALDAGPQLRPSQRCWQRPRPATPRTGDHRRCGPTFLWGKLLRVRGGWPGTSISL